MANAVSKESVKWFVTAVVAELDKRNNAKFASNTALNAVKSDLTDLEDKVADIDADKFVVKVQGKGLSSNDFTNEEKALLAELANATNATFDEEDVADVFS